MSDNDVSPPFYQFHSSPSVSSPLPPDLPPLSKVTHHSVVALPTKQLCVEPRIFQSVCHYCRAAKDASSLYYLHFLLSHMYVLIMVCCNSSLCVILSSVNSQRAAPRGAAGEDSLHVVARTGSKGTDGERIDS